MDRPEWKVFSKFGEWLYQKKADIQSAEGLAGLPRTLIVQHRAWSLRWSYKGSGVHYTNIHETRQQKYQSTNESVSTAAEF